MNYSAFFCASFEQLLPLHFKEPVTEQSKLVLNDVVDNTKFEFVEDEVVLACRNMQKAI